MIRRFILTGILIIIGLAAPVSGDDTANGIIEGQVTNGTAGGSSVTGVKITLNIYRDGAGQKPRVNEADADGKFIFNGLATEAVYSYVVGAAFQGVEYQSQRITFAAGENITSIEIKVYDTTDSDQAITVALAHTILYPRNVPVLVKEYYLFTNGGDRTYIGSVPGSVNGTLLFSLPPGATDLQTSLGLLKPVSGNGFVNMGPVMPGMYEVSYSYRLNEGLPPFTFIQKFIYNTIRFDFLVQGEDYQVESDQLKVDEPLGIGGVNYTHLSGQGFMPGSSAAVRLSVEASTANRSPLTWIIAGAVVLISAGIVFTILFRRRKEVPVAAQANLGQRRARLLDEIAELDDRFEDGSIKEEYYRKLRDEKKAELAELMRKQKGA